MEVKKPQVKTWEWMTFHEAYLSDDQHESIKAELQKRGVDEDTIAECLAVQSEVEVWRNDTYQVSVFRNSDRIHNQWADMPEMVHLSIKRNDREPLHDWRDLWAIKNCIVGPEHDALELYPAESRLVDGANQYHLWVFEDASVRVPFGMTEKMVGNEAFENGKQRPFPDVTYPERIND